MAMGSSTPDNPTALSIAGVLKWLLILLSAGPLILAFSAAAEAAGQVREGKLSFGFMCLAPLPYVGIAATMWVAAWVLWYF